jgi:ribulose-5-phosphate 4-epimerase/fuculose-1-phosphate aldolase
MKKLSVLKPKSIRDQVSAEEWETRVDLAACYRLMARYGMTDMIYNHITARVPGEPGHFLINPYGFFYEEITASSLYKIDHDGNVVLKPDTDCGINYAGFVIHSAVHAARADVHCAIHTHTRAGMAVSSMKCGLLPLNQTSMRFYGRLSYHDFEGPAMDLDERQRLARDLGNNKAMILNSHGLLACGESISEAFSVIYFLENACKAQVDAMSAGTELILCSPEVGQKTASAFDTAPTNQVGKGYDGSLEWTALLRRLDSEDSSYAS